MGLQARLRTLDSGWRRPSPTEAAEHVAVALAVAVFAWVVRSSGGRDVGVMAPAILLTLPAVIATRPWRRIGPGVSLLAASIPLGGLVVALVTPLHFSGSQVLASLTYGPLLFLAFAGYTRGALRGTALAGALCIAGFWEYWQAFVPWRAGGTPSRAMVGTFYQPDMYGAFCVGIAALSVALALRNAGWARILGCVTGPFAAVGVILSGGRAPEILLGLVWVGAALALLRSPRMVSDLLVWLGVAAATALLLLLMVSPVVFPKTGHWSFSTAVSGTTSRTGTQAAGFSVAVRRVYWHVAVDDFLAHPGIGQGFGSYGIGFPRHFNLLGPGQQASIYAHNAVLQNLAEGGLVAGLPLAAGAVAAALGIGRGLWRSVRRMADPVVLGGCLTASALLVHALFDLDWAYPAVAGFLGIALACVSAGPSRVVLAQPGRVGGALVATAVSGVMAYPVAAYASVSHAVARGTTAVNAQRYAAATRTLDTDGWPILSDARPSTLLIQEAAGRLQNGEIDPFPAAVMTRALARTRSVARVDPSVGMARAWVVFGGGRRAEAMRAAAQVVDEAGSYRPDVVESYAALLAADGQGARAERVLLAAVERFAQPRYWAPADVIKDAVLLRVIAGPDADSTACAWSLVQRAFPGSVREIVASPLSDRGPPAICPGTTSADG